MTTYMQGLSCESLSSPFMSALSASEFVPSASHDQAPHCQPFNFPQVSEFVPATRKDSNMNRSDQDLLNSV